VEYRQLGRSGLKISPICLGTMMFGGPADEATSTRIVAKAREAGVNFIDTYFRSGLYPWPSTPLIPGAEAAGEVAAVGAAVTDLKVGDRVAYTLPLGAYRTQRVVPAERLVLAPDCGMKYLPRESASGKLRAMTEAATRLRAELGG